MKRSNNDCQDNDTCARPRKQITLGPFLMKNESNLKPLAKATLKRDVLAEWEKEDKVAQHDKNKALKKFKKLCNINNAKIIREGAQTTMKRGIVNAISKYD